MRNPFRTEQEAFRFVLLTAVLFGAIAVAAILGGGWVALGVFLGIVLGGCAFHYVRREPAEPEPAVWERRPHAGPRRVLVMANETVAGRALRGEIGHRTGRDRAEVIVISPALNTRIRHWTSDDDHARDAAQKRLDASLSALAQDGIRSTGQIGDSDPLQALEDGLRNYRPDEVIISTHPPGRSNWLERDLIATARDRFDVPISHVVVDLDHEAAGARSRGHAGSQAAEPPGD